MVFVGLMRVWLFACGVDLASRLRLFGARFDVVGSGCGVYLCCWFGLHGFGCLAVCLGWADLWFCGCWFGCFLVVGVCLMLGACCFRLCELQCCNSCFGLVFAGCGFLLFLLGG